MKFYFISLNYDEFIRTCFIYNKNILPRRFIFKLIFEDVLEYIFVLITNKTYFIYLFFVSS